MIRGEDVGQRLLLRLPRMRGDDPDVCIYSVTAY